MTIYELEKELIRSKNIQTFEKGTGEYQQKVFKLYFYLKDKGVGASNN